ncbi:PEP-CTERM sorting domain-containing protein [Haloferula chungangensis]|uniref:PEP-CTERM sorting domain-containing protein n=2 Tax=Haloferula chungangensis TaxID=1048331 RepID=A0ABW2L8I8_9BACT
MNRRNAALLVVAGAAIGMPLQTAGAATIDIEGRLADSTEESALEWGDNSTRGDSSNNLPIGSNMPAPVSDDDGTVTLTVSTNIQDWRTGYSTGSYDAGEEWNVRSSSNAAAATGAFSNGAFFSITLDSTTNSSERFSWQSVAVSLWRNGSGADTTFQLAIDADGNGFTVEDLVGAPETPLDGIAGATTILFDGAELPDNVTSGEVRLYTWGTTSIAGNIHVYDVSADYVVVPEPSAASLMAIVGCGFLLRRSRSRSM